ncbi:MAG TPA: phosphotransferase [Streptosporangiaceae bacterium]|nr:phosphotransferase [Streptosporangiaceae bacterium]
MITELELRSCLERHWGIADAHVSVHNGGMGSDTWFVEHEACQWVAKAVPASAGSQFKGGLGVAQWLKQAGISAGAPVPLPDGRLAASVGGDWLALLTWVPGRPLSSDSPADRELLGVTLARVHRALAGYRPERAQRFHWVDPQADHLSLRPWVRPAVAAAVDALDAAGLHQMTHGLLHTDPAPEAFRFDEATGRCGVIDWSYCIHGPLLYDLASAVMYVGGPGQAGELTEAYLRTGVLGRAEVGAGLALMLRFRWAVQADYFAWRISASVMTGIDELEENEKGLEDARRFLLP